MSKKLWFWLILCVGIALRVYGITNPLLDAHGWRQADTASMAANFLERGFLPLIPQLNYDGPPPNYVELEFPLSALLIALLWKFTGQLDWVARAVEIAFSAGTLVLLYFLGKELYDRSSGLIAMAFFALNPLAIYYGRAVMPESSMIFFTLAAVLCMVRWFNGEQVQDLMLAGLFFGLAVLAKLPALMMALPLLGLLALKYNYRVLKAKQAWLFVIIGIICPLIYYLIAHKYAATRYVSGIIQGQASLKPDYEYLFQLFRKKVTWALLVPGLLGLGFRTSRIGNAFIWIWAGTLFVYTFAVGTRIQLEYYIYPIIPFLCLLAGATLGRFWGDAPGIISTLLILGTMANFANKELPIYYQVDYRYLKQAEKLQKITVPGELLVLNEGPPMTFYYSNRKGWRLLPGYQTPEELERLRQKGAAAFAVLPGSKLDKPLQDYLAANYPLNADGNFYDLRK